MHPDGLIPLSMQDKGKSETPKHNHSLLLGTSQPDDNTSNKRRDTEAHLLMQEITHVNISTAHVYEEFV